MFTRTHIHAALGQKVTLEVVAALIYMASNLVNNLSTLFRDSQYQLGSLLRQIIRLMIVKEYTCSAFALSFLVRKCLTCAGAVYVGKNEPATDIILLLNPTLRTSRLVESLAVS